ncbi:MAG TPA: hypothetical protein VF331_19205, partial [Polyangiales bacterium]
HAVARLARTSTLAGPVLASLFIAIFGGACTKTSCPGGSVERGGVCTGVGKSSVVGHDSGSDPGYDPGASDAIDAGPFWILADGGSSSDAAMLDDSGPTGARPADPCSHASCDPNAACSVQQGQAVCECRPGHIGDGLRCTVDPCYAPSNAPAVCGANAVCTPRTGSPANLDCSCQPHYADCDSASATAVPGCETNLSSSVLHCGSCGHACAGTLQCVQGTCVQAAARLVAADEATCALLPSTTPAQGSTVQCWGMNNYLYQTQSGQTTSTTTYHWQLLDDTSFDQPYSAVPRTLPIQSIVDISNGGIHACALIGTGAQSTVQCWGMAGTWLGTPTGTTTGSGTDSHGTGSIALPGATRVAAGASMTCALAQGIVSCWGENSRGSLGVAATNVSSTSTPVQAAGISGTVVDLHAAANVACALTDAGGVYCWGFGALNGDQGAQHVKLSSGVVPNDTVQLAMGADALEAYGNETLACALRASGGVMCWGGRWTPLALAGAGDGVAVSVPGTPAAITQIAVGNAHLCMLVKSGEVWCMGGHPESGALGFIPASGVTEVTQPTKVPGIDDAIEVVAGGFHTCVRRASGQVQCWGRNKNGELGDNTTSLRSSPVNVVGLP